jgi:hypothetical protein
MLIDASVNLVDTADMGGAGATDDLGKGVETQVVLAAPKRESPLSEITVEYLHHLRVRSPDSRSRDTDLQAAFLERCAQLSGVSLDRHPLSRRI